MTSILIVEKGGNLKSLSVKDYQEDELFKNLLLVQLLQALSPCAIRSSLYSTRIEPWTLVFLVIPRCRNGLHHDLGPLV